MKTNIQYFKSTGNEAEFLIKEADMMTHGRACSLEYTIAFRYYQEAEKMGSDVATDRIGRCYWAGLGVDRNLHLAAVHFLKAARMGNANAMYNLGHFMNGEGKGCKMGQKRAIYWFEKAAEKGVPSAYCNLGYAYLNGEGVRVDYAKAMQWFLRGGEKGSSACLVQAGLMFFQGLGVEEDPTKAIPFFERAALDENSDANLYLGYCYEYGKGVRRSLIKADEHYEKADMFGNVNALDEIFAFEKRHPLFKLYKKTSMMLKFLKCHIKYSCLSC